MLSKTIKTLGKMTAECHLRHSSLAKDLDDRYIFSECFLSSVESTLGKKKKRCSDGAKTLIAGLPSVFMEIHSAKIYSLPSATALTRGKHVLFFCRMFFSSFAE